MKESALVQCQEGYAFSMPTNQARGSCLAGYLTSCKCRHIVYLLRARANFANTIQYWMTLFSIALISPLNAK